MEQAAFHASFNVTVRVWGRGSLFALAALSAKVRVGLGSCVWGFPFWSVIARDQLTFRVFVTLGSVLGTHEHRQGSECSPPPPNP